ncbi:hypothetical protein [Jiulongibacter sediminis]|uniref:hypothetical protein n=1 Tax=Jiulongibacter sediminis TaxID=1605367 RepID=UPI0026ED110A|nr:hypothetical protein [Jiulongibacter sediminis]
MRQSRKILVPNDFSVRPLILLKKIMEQDPNHNFEIMLLNGVYPPDNVSSLLFYNKTRVVKENESSGFINARDLFKQKFRPRIKAFYSEVITSKSRFALNAFLKTNNIQEIYLPEGMIFQFNQRESFDPIPLLKKASLPVKTISFENEHEEKTSRLRDLTTNFINDLKEALLSPPYEGRLAVS